MSMIANQWYRIDKGDGRILAVNAVNVLRAAQGSYDNAADVIKSGRFVTNFAIYTRGDKASQQEQEQPRGLAEGK